MLVACFSLLVLPTCIIICYIARCLIVLYVLMFDVLFKVLGRLCISHRLANLSCILNVCNSCCLRVLWV